MENVSLLLLGFARTFSGKHYIEVRFVKLSVSPWTSRLCVCVCVGGVGWGGGVRGSLSSSCMDGYGSQIFSKFPKGAYAKILVLFEDRTFPVLSFYSRYRFAGSLALVWRCRL